MAALAGRRVLGVEVGVQRLRVVMDSAAFRGLLPGKRLEGIRRHGKYLVLALGDSGLLVHLGMSGRLIVAASGDALAAHTHLVVGFDGGRELRFVDPRRFGMVEALPLARLAGHPLLARLGPDALEAAAVAALGAAHRSVAPIHAVLLDQPLGHALLEPLYRAIVAHRRRIGRLLGLPAVCPLPSRPRAAP